MNITKEKRAELDTQEKVTEWVLTHAKEQGRKSIRQGSCQYRGLEHTACFVGCLILDEEYDDDMEGKSVNALIEFLAREQPDKVELWEFLVKNRSRLMRLQGIHDNYEVEDWESKIKELL